ncbi:hypothetical protein NDU88_009463 [Pleurodeles waltl]|uniref:Uncharacterized protein n=1 Tax=Pleurodeles waltl TaxID=8319 RepID=A0AAV7RYJ5_PLEWA|nr:hypothetical protein NDU88_009463 [Pleurodeles waltl]
MTDVLPLGRRRGNALVVEVWANKRVSHDDGGGRRQEATESEEDSVREATENITEIQELEQEATQQGQFQGSETVEEPLTQKIEGRMEKSGPEQRTQQTLGG